MSKLGHVFVSRAGKQLDLITSGTYCTDERTYFVGVITFIVLSGRFLGNLGNISNIRNVSHEILCNFFSISPSFHAFYYLWNRQLPIANCHRFGVIKLPATTLWIIILSSNSIKMFTTFFTNIPMLGIGEGRKRSGVSENGNWLEIC